MNRFRQLLLLNKLKLLLLFFIAFNAFQEIFPIYWPADKSDLKQDESFISKQLPNGFRFSYKQNKTPEKQIYLYLVVSVGSTCEKENEDGISHFIEHLSFSNTNEFPNDSLLSFFQNHGMVFGSNINAGTGLSYTSFMLNLPSSDLLEKGILGMKGIAHGVNFEKKFIERERKIIIAEKRASKSIREKINQFAINNIFKNTIIGKNCDVIGSEKSINSFQKEDFQRFYDTWYKSPDNMTLVITGDFDPKILESLVTKHFGSIERKTAPEKPEFEWTKLFKDFEQYNKTAFDAFEYNQKILEKKTTDDIKNSENKKEQVLSPEKKNSSDDFFPIHINFFQEKEIPSNKVKYVVTKERSYPFTKKATKEDFLRNFVISLLDDRFQVMLKEKDCPFFSESIYSFSLESFCDFYEIELICKENKWPETLSKIEQEIRRIFLFGFDTQEIEMLKSNILSSIKQSIERKGSLESSYLATSFIDTLVNQKCVYLSPETNLEIANELFKETKPSDLLKIFKDIFGKSSIHNVFVISKEKISENPKKDIYFTIENSLKMDVLPREILEVKTFAYKNFGVPSKLENRIENKKNDFVSFKFGNNVRFNFKNMTNKKDMIFFKVNFGGGLLELKKPISIAIENTFCLGGLKDHSEREFRYLFAGKLFNYDFSVLYENFEFEGSSSKKDFSDCMSLICAHIKYPGFREEGLVTFHKSLNAIYEQSKNTIYGVRNNQVERFIRSGDARFGLPSKDVLEKIKMTEIESAMQSALKSGYMEITIVGDISEKEAVDIISRTFGSLDKREKCKPSYKKERVCKFPKVEKHKTFYVESSIEKAFVESIIPACDFWNLRDSRAFDVLENIVMNRLIEKIRIEKGLAYSPFTSAKFSKTFKNYGFLSVVSGVEPKFVENMQKSIRFIFQDLYEKGVNSNEFEIAIKQIIETNKQHLGNPQFWLSALSDVQNNQNMIKYIESYIKDYEKLAKTEVERVVKKYCNPKNIIEIVILPKK